MIRRHRATGNPSGRPISVSAGLGLRIMEALRRRADPETGLVEPHWKRLARELGVSRSTLCRQIYRLRLLGKLESVADPKSGRACYRLKG